MTKKPPIFALIFSSILSASVYAGCNPASTCYVDRGVTTLQSEIASIPRLPSGGTTGQILAKASNNNYDTQWVTQSGGPQYTVGQSAFGGVIFYVDSTGQHGLVAATADESGGANYTWGLSTTSGTAQYQCANKTTGGHTDWIVPNKAQATLLFNNRYAIDPSDPNGGFSDTTLSNASVYWTSTESDSAGSAWFQYFGVGYQGFNGESNPLSVRCVRAF